MINHHHSDECTLCRRELGIVYKKKDIIKIIKERERNYRELHITTKMAGALDKWEAMVELLLALEGTAKTNKTKVGK